MTKTFNVKYCCQHCGELTTAETGFGRWMRNHPDLDSYNGIVRTDTDHWILRYKTSPSGRDFQLLMAVEVKEYGSFPDAWQVDILSFVRQMVEDRGVNIANAKTVLTRKLKSKFLNRIVKVRFYGVHLLQFEKTSPQDSKWISWNGKNISAETLLGILAMELNPYSPNKRIEEHLRDRHITELELNFK